MPLQGEGSRSGLMGETGVLRDGEGSKRAQVEHVVYVRSLTSGKLAALDIKTGLVNEKFVKKKSIANLVSINVTV